MALVFLAFLGSCKSYNKSVYEFKNEFGILPVEGELPVTLRTKYFDITYSSSTTKKLYKLKTKIKNTKNYPLYICCTGRDTSTINGVLYIDYPIFEEEANKFIILEASKSINFEEVINLNNSEKIDFSIFIVPSDTDNEKLICKKKYDSKDKIFYCTLSPNEYATASTLIVRLSELNTKSGKQKMRFSIDALR